MKNGKKLLIVLLLLVAVVLAVTIGLKTATPLTGMEWLRQAEAEDVASIRFAE